VLTVAVVTMPPAPTVSPLAPTDTPIELTVRYVAVKVLELSARPLLPTVTPDAVKPPVLTVAVVVMPDEPAVRPDAVKPPVLTVPEDVIDVVVMPLVVTVNPVAVKPPVLTVAEVVMPPFAAIRPEDVIETTEVMEPDCETEKVGAAEGAAPE